ncbi:MAG: YicC/YloC family endoribonuclease [Gemmatimonadota bacterium]
MTGFGAAEDAVLGGRLRVEIRTVNHRYFNLSLKLPFEFGALEGEFRDRLRKEFERGHVTVMVRWVADPAKVALPRVNLEQARVVLGQLQALQAELKLPGQVDLGLLVRQPDVLQRPEEESVQLEWGPIEPVVIKAASACKAMRQREGQVLSAELEHRLDLLEAAAKQIAAQAPSRVLRERERLRQAVTDLMKGTVPDENRLAQEIAFIADKLDITEELVRFRAHVSACRAALSGTPAAGKQLGFLAQELGREVNTIGSKANDATITQQVILMKGELEKFREQLENLE